MNEEQRNVLEHVKRGKNLLLTGAAGTGKSFTLKEIIKVCRNIAVTSSTGISALTIGGRTLHSYLRIGLGKKDPYQLYLNLKRKYPKDAEKIAALQTLVIDEISMISAELLDKVSLYLQYVRKQKIPFGGLQVILCGDMFQLPPVDGEYCFKAECWDGLNLVYVELKTQMRQQIDVEFANLLNDARLGICSDDSFSLLKKCRSTTFGEIVPTVLYSKNVDVDYINEREFRKLSDNGAETRSYDTVFSQHKDTKSWAESLKIPEKIELCIGAQVILTANLSVEEGFVNGSRGMVTGFAEEGVIVLFKHGDQIIIQPYTYIDENDEVIFASLIPLKLAYALTIHKSQSLTLDAATIDLGPGIFTYGQAYVALSRVRDRKSVRVINILKDSFRANPEVLEFYKRNFD
jgi:ATP-dependent DNA helicase PIF1